MGFPVVIIRALALLCCLAFPASAAWHSVLQACAPGLPCPSPTPFGLDGTSNIVVGSTAASFTLTLTTTQTNDIIIVHILDNIGSITSISDTAGLSWSVRAQVGAVNDNISEWYAKSSGILTGDTITVTPLTSGGYNTAVAFGISGTTNFASPFDSGAPQTSASPPVSMTTATAGDFVFGMCRSGGASNPTVTGGTGTWTGIVSGVTNSFMGSGYQIFAAAGSLTFAISGSNTNCIVDAVVP